MDTTTSLELNFENRQTLVAALHRCSILMHEPQKRLHVYKVHVSRCLIVHNTNVATSNPPTNSLSYASDSLWIVSIQNRTRCIDPGPTRRDIIQHGPEEGVRRAINSCMNRKTYFATSWYDKILEYFKDWSQSSDVVESLVRWDEIRADLDKIFRTCPGDVMKAQAKQSSSQLSDIRVFSRPNVRETLDALWVALSSKDDVARMMQLTGPKARSIINLLDEALNVLEIRGRLHSKALHTLRKLCASRGVLPDSFKVNSQDLKLIKDHPEASGGFADIWLGQYKEAEVALKVFRIYGRDNLQAVHKASTFGREAVLWKRLRHANIVEFIGVNTELFPLSMVCEWMKNGDVMSFLKAHPGSNRLELLVDIGQGLEFLHSLGILHGDLKGANVLVNDKLHACLTDFGLTAVTYDPNTVNAISTSSSVNGSIRWMPPEILNPEHAGLEKARSTPESDIYSFAMVMWEMFTGCIPFYENTRDPQVVFRVILGIRPERPALSTPLGLSDPVWDLMESCWHGEWQRRPRIPIVLQTLRGAFEEYGIISARPAAWPLLANHARDGIRGDAAIIDSAELPGMHFTLPRSTTEGVSVYPPSFAVSLQEEVGMPEYLSDIATSDDVPTALETLGINKSPHWEFVAHDEAWV
ncbi:uncharacterized protein FIBRA_00661 [Fibroporia radiculosa]|uniref:Protein kinase domain-containing protein n=1 Tax=Fibroporia radiculosa TaxID=599839 RepID=J4H0F3_9APHY|nr:uncharacterized protein FIBRA_00661 [Fibroporia radiculosa]CCL98659.1 predicted protein [Fibroporia radiculosa]